MRYTVITLFPESFESYLDVSILEKAIKSKKISVQLINPRKFAEGKHKKVDDSPYGGGPGMVLKFEPIAKAVAFAIGKSRRPKGSGLRPKASEKLKVRTILFSTRGKKFISKEARRLAKYDELIMICGRYEGVDERVAKYIADEEISIGDYILEGGELPALVLIDAVSRHIPGVLGKKESLEEIKGSYPVYTRPEIIKIKTSKLRRPKGSELRPKASEKLLRVPKVLLSGNHKKIAAWRERF